MPTISTLKVKLFTDGAEKSQILEMAKQPWIRGFTTNPSLLKKAGVSDYPAMGAISSRPSRIGTSHLKCFPTTFQRWSHRLV